MFKAKIKDEEFLVEQGNDSYSVNNELFEADITQISEGKYSLISNNKVYNLEIVKSNFKKKDHLIKINGHTYPVKLLDKMDLLLEKMGIDSSAEEKITELQAPMPGLILEIAVAPGDTVQEGDKLVVLEAMKMENVLKSTGQHVVAEVNIKVGDSVEYLQSLIRFE